MTNFENIPVGSSRTISSRGKLFESSEVYIKQETSFSRRNVRVVLVYVFCL